jgi:hypothetical protein
MWLMQGMIAVKAALLARGADQGGVSRPRPGKAIRATGRLAVGMQVRVGASLCRGSQGMKKPAHRLCAGDVSGAAIRPDRSGRRS